MSKETLESVNARLVEHLKEKGITDACYYAPVCDDYWFAEKKIAFCNLEPYSKEGAEHTIKGIQCLDEERLYNSWFHKPTAGNTLLLNYVLCQCLKDKQQATEETFAKVRAEGKSDAVKTHGNICDTFDNSLYFNFRYTQSPTVNEDKVHTLNAYRNDAFYIQHYKDFVKAAEINVLVLGGKTALELIQMVYPDLQGKLTFCGEPVLHDGILFVSMTHPSRIKDDEMASVVNKITQTLK